MDCNSGVEGVDAEEFRHEGARLQADGGLAALKVVEQVVNGAVDAHGVGAEVDAGGLRADFDSLGVISVGEYFDSDRLARDIEEGAVEIHGEVVERLVMRY